MIHLDTHILVWLYEGRSRRLARAASDRLRRSPSLTISPLVLIELDNLITAHRVRAPTPDVVVAAVSDAFKPITISKAGFHGVVSKALSIGWTRDPFDLLIVANAMADDAELITADEKIRTNFKDAVWD